jgi:hypothetical protein
VEQPSGRIGSWENHIEDQKLGKDEGNIEGTLWSEKLSVDRMKSVVGS